jgi:hypothetical protein
MNINLLIVVLTAFLVFETMAFCPGGCVLHRARMLTSSAHKNEDSSEIIAKRIVVSGDVQGGYYRSCVRNEVRNG